MTTYFKNSNYKRNRSLSLETTGGNLRVIENVPTDFDPDAVKDNTYSLSEIRDCDITGTPSSDYVVIAVGVDSSDGGIKISMLPFTSETKAQTTRALNITPIAYIGFAVGDTSFDNAIVLCNAEALTVDGTEITAEKAGIPALFTAMGGITLSKSGNTVTAQLVDGSGANLSTSGVTVFFETTAGALDVARADTDANGQATATLTVADGVTGKVKAGFKNFTGAAEVQI